MQASVAKRASDDIPVVSRLSDLTTLVADLGECYLRFSNGPDADAREKSRDHESGCVLPGLSVNPLRPEPWWDRPVVEWLARQLCQYIHLADGDDRAGWVLTGRVVGRGPDCEPLVADVTPVAWLSQSCLDAARELYNRTFDVGNDGT